MSYSAAVTAPIPAPSLEQRRAAAIAELPPCDVCGDPIEAGERYTHDPKGETTHNDCARDWFRRSFGREAL